MVWNCILVEQKYAEEREREDILMQYTLKYGLDIRINKELANKANLKCVFTYLYVKSLRKLRCFMNFMSFHLCLNSVQCPSVRNFAS